jgi:DTW domain-containing protein YfiP
MSKRRATRDQRCIYCKVNLRWCFCDRIQKIDTESHVSIIMHHRERFLTSNTALLTQRLLNNCDISLRGHLTKPFNFKLMPQRTPLYLFPHEEALELTNEYVNQINSPIQLIVPDGSWRQAKKFYRRTPELAGIQCVKITPPQKSRYSLRSQSSDEGLCTIEAIAYALGVIEDSSIKKHLIDGLDVMNERVDVSRKSELWDKEYKY